MATSQPVNILSPIGRIVQGSLYDPSTTDAEGKPLVVKNGPNAGQARVNYFFAIAIPKKPGETHFAQTEWGAKIWQVGHTAFPGAAQSPTFAWKVEDGDSQIPNKKGRRPCDQEGYAGNWIVKFSNGFTPRIYRQEGQGFVQELQKDFVKPGHYVEVRFQCDGNGSQSQPGVYLNHQMICFRAYGPEIVFGPTVEEAGFGVTPLPAGASMIPVGSSVPPPNPTPAGVPGVAPVPSSVPVIPAMPQPSTVGVPPVAPSSSAGPIPVIPNTQFLQVPPPVPSPAAAVPPTGASVAASPGVTVPVPSIPTPPSSGPTMTAKAGGQPRESFIAAGWTDAMLISEGYMTI